MHGETEYLSYRFMLNLTSYHAAQDGVAWADRSERMRLEVGGRDRAKFLHNLTTNEVKRLPPGRGCETFVTSLQGKTLAIVNMLACRRFHPRLRRPGRPGAGAAAFSKIWRI